MSKGNSEELLETVLITEKDVQNLIKTLWSLNDTLKDVDFDLRAAVDEIKLLRKQGPGSPSERPQ